MMPKIKKSDVLAALDKVIKHNQDSFAPYDSITGAATQLKIIKRSSKRIYPLDFLLYHFAMHMVFQTDELPRLRTELFGFGDGK